ncbi:MAG: hypothetical protein K2G63_06295 [Oscillospiraceae bacterium]|nr:hypothetical protein [Oscillospiraceae bacterium]
MKKFTKLKSIVSAFIVVCSMSLTALNANGATIDDCAEVARSYGVSESIIQSAYNAYYSNPDAYTPEDFETAINTLHLYGTDSDLVIKQYFGITDTPQNPDSSSVPDSNPDSVSDSDLTSDSNPDPVIGDTDNNNSDSSSDNQSGGISSSDFINMSIDDKVSYVQSLPENERAGFIENLTTEERNSIIKQLPMDNKTELLSRFVEAGEQMGLNMTVDNIDGDNISVSVRNNDGVLVDQSGLGATVEDTGYDYRMLFALVSAGIAISSAGIYFIFRKILKDDRKI